MRFEFYCRVLKKRESERKQKQIVERERGQVVENGGHAEGHVEHQGCGSEGGIVRMRLFHFLFNY